MTKRTAANRYARALLDVVLAERQVDPHNIETELVWFVDLVGGHGPLERALSNPVVPAPRKRAAVQAVTTRLGTSPVLAKLLSLLAERDRLVLLPDLLEEYRRRLLDHENIVRAEVTTAAPIGEAKTRAVAESLAVATGRTVTVAARVDPSIIGGVVARIGSTVYDGSITTQLQNIKKRLTERA